MKKSMFFAAVVSAALSLGSCGSLGNLPTNNTANTSTSTSAGTDLATAGSSILNNLLGSLLSNTLNEQSFVGTWTYQNPEVRFESENLLAQAGGSVVASSIEAKLDGYLSKIGIAKGKSTYTFNEDKTFSIATNGRTIATGTYTYDKSSKVLTLQGTLGLMNQTCTVGMDGTNLCLLYDADKLLTVMNTVGSMLGKSNSTIANVTTLLGQNYQGMKIGFSLSK